MRVTRLVITVVPALILPLCVLIGCDRDTAESKKQKESSSSDYTSTASHSPTATGDLQEAIKARTEVTAVQEEIIGLDADIRQAMRKVLAKAEAKQTAGNILLTKDRYAEAVAEYNEAVRLYRQVVDGRKQLEKLAEAQRAVDAARTLAESSAKPEQLQKAKAVEMNADGYVKAGEVDLALAELDKARQAYEALTPAQEQATLEQAVAARTAMLVARQQIKGLPTFDESTTGVARAIRGQQRESGKGPKPGSMADLLGRAAEAESAGSEALEQRHYGRARALFASAEKSYRDAAVIQARREQVLASRGSVTNTINLADKAFKSEARPASFERGKQALANADKALADDNTETATKLLVEAAQYFADAQGESEQMNALTDAQQAWSAALAGADEQLVNRYASGDFLAAKAKAADAEAKASAGKPTDAIACYAEAVQILKKATDTAATADNSAKAALVIQRLETALAGKAKFEAEDILAELETLIPGDPRMGGLRSRVKALPGPKKNLLVDLGGRVKLELVLIRPGKFQMGGNNEKPVHQVTIGKPFYMGKYEVTQEQWQAIMGSNPSHFEGAKNPVDNVSWDDCQSFVAKLNEKVKGQRFTLPTEAQWEYACRAGTTTEFSFGDAEGSLGEYAWFNGNAGSTTHPVGQKKPNAWGLCDMHGNVWEWCADWYGDYADAAQADPKGPASGTGRVLRGGSWSYLPAFCRSAFRRKLALTSRHFSYGLRLAAGSLDR